MFWQDAAIMLRSKLYGEKGAIITVFAQHHGIWSGYIHEKQARSLQVGSLIQARWQARDAEQLGIFQCEIIDIITARFLHKPKILAALSSACTITAMILPPHQENQDIFQRIIDFFSICDAAQDSIMNHHNIYQEYIYFEFDLLELSGFAFDWKECAISHVSAITQALCYVSPKTGRAINQQSYQQQLSKHQRNLLPLPKFLLQYALHKECIKASQDDINNAFNLLGYFLQTYVLDNKNSDFPYHRALILQ